MASGNRKQGADSGIVRNTNHRSQHNVPSRAEDRSKRNEEQNSRIVRALANRCYHLPGNGWCQDWCDYFRNNHPLFGIWFHHKLHPLGMFQRVVALIGSIAFGLAATNIVFLWFFYNDEDPDRAALEFDINSNVTGTALEDEYNEVTITNGMIALWTFGGGLHSIFDLTIWYMSACGCCRTGGCNSMLGCLDRVGSYLVIAIVTVTVALATFVVVLRASLISRDNELAEGKYDDEIEFGDVEGAESFSFLLSYVIELGLALFAWYPVMGTILFSGVLGCGRLPLLGGRPREIRMEKEQEDVGNDEATVDEDVP